MIPVITDKKETWNTFIVENKIPLRIAEKMYPYVGDPKKLWSIARFSPVLCIGSKLHPKWQVVYRIVAERYFIVLEWQGGG